MAARSIARWFLLTAAALVLVACGGGETATGVKAFVTAVDDSDLYLGVAIDGEEILGFLTDGKGVARWLSGSLEGNSMYLSGEGDARLRGRVVDDRVEGSVSIGGKTYPVNAPLAREGGGVYRAEDEGEVSGWVVLPDGSQKGATTARGQTGPAPTLSVFALSPQA